MAVRDSRHDSAPLAWAVTEASRRGAPLEIVHAWTRPHDVSPLGIPQPALDAAPQRARAETVIADAVAALPPGARSDAADATHLAVEGRPGAVLVELSRKAGLLVVGTRGHGAVRGLIGSVTHQCLHHAQCPVAVIPPQWASTEPVQRIAVGIDGSDGSKRALRWAMEEASRWNAELVVVHAWDTPYPVEPWGIVITPRDQELFEQRADELIRDLVEFEVRTGAPAPASLRVAPRADASGPALVEESKTVDLLVVGSRGRGGFAALLVGSTSLHCVHHAACPVVIVPSER